MKYSEIVNLALTYSDRSDREVVNRIGDFLHVVESRVNRQLKTQRMTARTVTILAADQEYYALPGDFAGMRDIEIRQNLEAVRRLSLTYVTPENLNNIAGLGYSGPSCFYTIVANQLQIFPRQLSGIIEIVYYRRLPHLADTSAAESNWLSEYNPDVYVFGLLVEISSFVKDPDAAILWDKRFLDALGEVSFDDQVSRWSGQTLTIRGSNG
jgi:hypothetical protein